MLHAAQAAEVRTGLCTRTEREGAAQNGHHTVCEALLKAGAAVNTRDDRQCTSLHGAAYNGHQTACEALLKAGAAVDARDDRQCTSLRVAARNGHHAVCEALLKAGADVDARDDRQCTSLRVAARNGHHAVCEVLLKAGATVDARTTNQWTPLHGAAYNGHQTVCEVLLKAGATVDARIDNQHTPLHLAAYKGHQTACEVLLKAGADVDARAEKQATPLYLAAQNGHHVACEALLKAGAAVDARTDKQVTPLRVAAYNDHHAACITLLAAGAKLDRTASDAASSEGHTALAKHLGPSGGVHCLRCTAPSRERVYVWNDAPEKEVEARLLSMQALWMLQVAEGREHALVALTIRGVQGGRMPHRALVGVMRYLTGGTWAYASACLSTRRVGVRGDPAATTLAGPSAASKRRKDDPAAQTPRLALVSHAMALRITPPHHVVPSALGAGARGRLLRVVQALETEARVASAGCAVGCPWLAEYCAFIRARFDVTTSRAERAANLAGSIS